jgi:hypothetical protein
MQQIATETLTEARAIPLGAELVTELISDDIVNDAAAGDAWAAPSWREAALEYHKARDGRVSIVPYAPEHLARLRHELHGRASGAAASPVEALVFGLRDGLAALPKNPDDAIAVRAAVGAHSQEI